MPQWLKITLIVIAGGIAALGLLGAGIVGFAFWLTASLVEPIDRQIAAMQAGNMPAAYEETSEAFRQATTLEAFVAFVDAHPILKDVASHEISNRSFENDVGTVEGTLTSSTGGVMPVTYSLVKEKEVWKIIHIELGKSGGDTAAQ